MVGRIMETGRDSQAAAAANNSDEVHRENSCHHRGVTEGYSGRWVTIDTSQSRLKRGSPLLEPPTTQDWSELEAELSAVLEHGGSNSADSRKPSVVRCRSEHALFSRKRGAEDCRDEIAPHMNPLGFASGSGSGIDDDDDEGLGLGAPPLLPPRLKRARAYSYSPDRSKMFFSDFGRSQDIRQAGDTGPRQ